MQLRSSHDPRPARPLVCPVPLDQFDLSVWRFALGLDMAWNPDKDAIAAVGWRRDDGAHNLWLVYEFEEGHQDVDELSAVFVPLVRRLRPLVIVGDNASGGDNKIIATLQNRIGGFEITPKPRDLDASTGLMNDELRTGRFRCLRGGNAAADFGQWQTVVKNGKKERSTVFHSDITEAARYAVWGATHWLGKDPPPPPSAEEKRRADLIALSAPKAVRYIRNRRRR